MRACSPPVVLALVVVAALLPSVDSHADPAREAEGGVPFIDVPWEGLQTRARQEHKRIMVEVWAPWCAPCKVQERQVFQTAEGAALTKDLLAWRVNFDDNATRALMKRWRVLRLPTVIFLRPDGTEIDRIEGYDDRTAWLAHARRAANGHDPVVEDARRLAALDRDVKRASSASAQDLRLTLGHAYLVRGDVGRGVGVLEDAIRRTPLDPARTEPDVADRALFHLGRYWSRVENDYEKGRAVWERLLARGERGPFAGTATWWIADADEHLGKPSVADGRIAAFVADAPTADRFGLAIEWMEHSHRPLPVVKALLLRAHVDARTRQELLDRYRAAVNADGAP